MAVEGLKKGRSDWTRGPMAGPGGEGWGGYLMLPKGPHVRQVKLTGILSSSIFDSLDRSLDADRQGNATLFVLLDAHHLVHIPMGVAMGLAAAERRWRARGAVVLWVGLSPYLANVILLACAWERLPSLPDMATAMRAVESVSGLPPAAARGRLEAWDIMRH